MVRTPGFHPGNRGSIPRGVTKMFSIRINTLKIDIDECKKQLTAESWDFETVKWCDYALMISGNKRDFFDSEFVTNGWCYIQSLSSLLPGILLGPEPDDRVLDLCAAPGGKTMHLAALMDNTGQIIANDVSRPRLYKTNRLLKEYGVTNVETNLGKGEFIWKEMENHFDRVLLDAPCSMGQVYANKNLRRLAMRQKYLLKSAFTALKPGGRLVYSTCTVTDQENQQVVAWLLKQCPEAKIIRPKLHPDLQQFVTTDNFVEIDDDKLFDPFFVAVIEK